MGKTSWRFSYLFEAYSAIFECIECEIWQEPRKPLRGSYTRRARSARDATIAHASARGRGVRRVYTASAVVAHTKFEVVALWASAARTAICARGWPATQLRAPMRARVKCEVWEMQR